jgi:hypothetical protein
VGPASLSTTPGPVSRSRSELRAAGLSLPAGGGWRYEHDGRASGADLEAMLGPAQGSRDVSSRTTSEAGLTSRTCSTERPA